MVIFFGVGECGDLLVYTAVADLPTELGCEEDPPVIFIILCMMLIPNGRGSFAHTATAIHRKKRTQNAAV